ncbi:MAG TPA: hypothetical protein VMA75_01375 [Candidatus Paceibacterota bacterium]|nr:hypothetical protein [Candidatus Paceibacterota bacterium]
MLNKEQYTPILKWKPAEQWALEPLDEKTKDALLPLIELVMPTVNNSKIVHQNGEKKKVKKSQEEIFAEVVKKFKEERINEIPNEIFKAWGSRPIFVDFTLLMEGELTTQLKVDALNSIVPAAMGLGAKLIPVLNLNDDDSIKAAACSLYGKYKEGLCLRIASSDLLDPEKLNEKIGAFLAAFNLAEKEIDLLVDIKAIQEKDGLYLQFLTASQKIKNLGSWKNFIFASGAFPKDVGECELDKPNFLPRADWHGWFQHVRTQKLVRKPNYADYTIRNPIFVEALQYYNSTTSIKYTLEKDWLVMKGKVAEFQYYLANAKLLVEDIIDDKNLFYGEKHCWGDKQIAEKAKHFHRYIKDTSLKGTGRAVDWIAWEINHHLKLVVDQIASLREKPIVHPSPSLSVHRSA